MDEPHTHIRTFLSSQFDCPADKISINVDGRSLQTANTDLPYFLAMPFIPSMAFYIFPLSHFTTAPQLC